jgi:Helix-turn-helix domain
MAECWPLQLTTMQKLVLISLADQANDEGATWPSVATLSQRVCAAERSVQNAIRDLSKLKLVHVERRQRRNGSSTSNLYTIDRKACRSFVGGVPDVREGGAAVAPSERVGGARNLRGGVQDVREGGAAVAPPEPSIEPSGEPTPPNPPRGARAIKDEVQAPSQAMTLSAWLAECEANGKQAIPDDHALHVWARNLGMSADLIGLHWSEFKRRWCTSSETKPDWGRVFMFEVMLDRYGFWTRLTKEGPVVPSDKALRALSVQGEAGAQTHPPPSIAAGPPKGLQ